VRPTLDSRQSVKNSGKTNIFRIIYTFADNLYFTQIIEEYAEANVGETNF
jgi:hypothetical protein